MVLQWVTAGILATTSLIMIRAGVRAMGKTKSAIPANKIKSTIVNATDVFSQPIHGVKFYEGSFNPEMSKKEALDILGFGKNVRHVTEEDVKKKHRKLMLLNHPDNGGSAYVSSKVNEAKDYLMGKSSRD
ncbi:hypothetical protein ABK040_016627 [Willaertia magna]